MGTGPDKFRAFRGYHLFQLFLTLLRTIKKISFNIGAIGFYMPFPLINSIFGKINIWPEKIKAENKFDFFGKEEYFFIFLSEKEALVSNFESFGI